MSQGRCPIGTFSASCATRERNLQFLGLWKLRKIPCFSSTPSRICVATLIASQDNSGPYWWVGRLDGFGLPDYQVTTSSACPFRLYQSDYRPGNLPIRHYARLLHCYAPYQPKPSAGAATLTTEPTLDTLSLSVGQQGVGDIPGETGPNFTTTTSGTYYFEITTPCTGGGGIIAIPPLLSLYQSGRAHLCYRESNFTCIGSRPITLTHTGRECGQQWGVLRWYRDGSRDRGGGTFGWGLEMGCIPNTLLSGKRHFYCRWESSNCGVTALPRPRFRSPSPRRDYATIGLRTPGDAAGVTR